MAETLVLIPGLLCDAISWQPVIDRLGQGVCADLSTQRTIAAMAADTLAAFSGPLAVAGHSMGARVAVEMWRQAPDRIARLALLDTGTHPAREAEKPGRARRVALAHEHGMQALCDDWLGPMVHPDQLNDPSVMEPLTLMVLSKTPDLHDRQIAALLGRPDAAPVLATVSCPVLVAVGRQDQWSPVAQHIEIAALIPQSKLVIIEDAGHFAPFERPDAVAAAMRDWLKA